MKQYNAIKNKYPDAMLLFRVGDFYETFGEDAKKAAEVLGITLTKRGAGSDSETALAGFPHHSLNTYLPKLVKAGMRVAICDQLEDPKMTKTIVKRGVTELVTPGVALNDEVLQSKTNNFLCSVYFGKNRQVEIGVLHDTDTRLADGMLAKSDSLPGRIVLRNEPYGPEHGVTHSLRLHALSRGLPNVMIEVRNDLLSDATAVQRICDELMLLLQQAMLDLNEGSADA